MPDPVRSEKESANERREERELREGRRRQKGVDELDARLTSRGSPTRLAWAATDSQAIVSSVKGASFPKTLGDSAQDIVSSTRRREKREGDGGRLR